MSGSRLGTSIGGRNSPIIIINFNLLGNVNVSAGLVNVEILVKRIHRIERVIYGRIDSRILIKRRHFPRFNVQLETDSCMFGQNRGVVFIVKLRILIVGINDIYIQRRVGPLRWISLVLWKGKLLWYNKSVLSNDKQWRSDWIEDHKLIWSKRIGSKWSDPSI